MANTIVRSEVTGTVWKLEVKSGDVVAEEQTLIILESMKMEIPVEAPVAGSVLEVRVEEGQLVQEGQELLVIG